MKKRLLSLVLTLCMLLSVIPAMSLPVSAAVGDEIVKDNIRYKVLTSNTVEVIAIENGSIRDLVIPGRISDQGKYYDVVAIAAGKKDGDLIAYTIAPDLDTLVIPGSVTSIGAYAVKTRYYGDISDRNFYPKVTMLYRDTYKTIATYAFGLECDPYQSHFVTDKMEMPAVNTSSVFAWNTQGYAGSYHVQLSLSGNTVKDYLVADPTGNGYISMTFEGIDAGTYDVSITSMPKYAYIQKSDAVTAQRPLEEIASVVTVTDVERTAIGTATVTIKTEKDINYKTNAYYPNSVPTTVDATGLTSTLQAGTYESFQVELTTPNRDAVTLRIPYRYSSGSVGGWASYDFYGHVDVAVPAYEGLEQVATPVINPNGGRFENSQTVTITCGTEDAVIYYSIDGGAAVAYAQPFNITASCTVTAYATKDGMKDSDTATAEFEIYKIGPPVLSGRLIRTGTDTIRVMLTISESTRYGYVFDEGHVHFNDYSTGDPIEKGTTYLDITLDEPDNDSITFAAMDDEAQSTTEHLGMLTLDIPAEIYDTAAPAITDLSAERTGSHTAEVTFTANKDGVYRYDVVSEGEILPSYGQWIVCVKGENTFTVTDIPDEDAKRIYVQMADTIEENAEANPGFAEIAPWTGGRTYTVTYDVNGGTGAAPVDTNEYKNGDLATVLSAEGITPPGIYTFMGWSLSQDGAGKLYQPGDTITVGVDMTLYARWGFSAVAIGFTVTYDVNGGSGTPPVDNNKYGLGDTVTIATGGSMIAPEKHQFAGWNTEPDGSGQSYSSIAPFNTFEIEGDVTLYAQWLYVNVKPIETFTVTYDANGGSGTVPVDENEYGIGQTVTVMGKGDLVAPDGYIFAGWNTQADGEGEQYDVYLTPGTFQIQGNVTLYAQWQKMPQVTPTHFTVTYNANGGEGTVPVDDNEYELNDTVTVLSGAGLTSPVGNIFNGWNTAANGSGTPYRADDTFTITENTVLYAQWAVTAVPNHEHPVCGVTCTHEGAHDAARFRLWEKTDALPTESGAYYLRGAVALPLPAADADGYWVIPAGVTVTLCLNGNNISIAGDPARLDFIYIEEGGSLTICNCSAVSANIYGNVVNDGTLTLYGGTLDNRNDYAFHTVDNNGVFTVYGGSIVSDESIGYGVSNGYQASFTMYGGVIDSCSKRAVINFGNMLMDGGFIAYSKLGIENRQELIIRGGEIRENTVGILQLDGSADICGGLITENGTGVMYEEDEDNLYGADLGRIILSGTADITGNTAHDLYLFRGATVDVGSFEDGAAIGIGMHLPGIFTSGNGGVDNSAYFTSRNADYEVRLDASGELTLYQIGDTTAPVLTPDKATRTSADGFTLTFTSNEGGRYYYQVTPKGALAPTFDTIAGGTVCDTSMQTILFTGLDSRGEYTCYVVVKDEAGLVSEPIVMDISAWYLLTYDANGGTGTPPAVEGFAASKNAYVADGNTMTPPAAGVVFAGWNTASDGSGESYLPGKVLTVTDDITLYAVWSAPAAHTHTLLKGDTAGESVTYTPWDSFDSLPTEPGNYYLLHNVTISERWEPADGTVLCLDGHYINLAGEAREQAVIYINAGVTLTLCDCNSQGLQNVFTIDDTGLLCLHTGTATPSGRRHILRFGVVTGGSYSGIDNRGTLYIYDAGVVGNTENLDGYGGGIYNDGDLYLYGFASILGNTAITPGHNGSGGGGGIYNGGTVTASGGAVYDNVADGCGGICSCYGEMIAHDLSVFGNSAPGGGGGGIGVGNAPIYLSGNVYIKDNTYTDSQGIKHPSDLFFRSDVPVKVGTFTADAEIGIDMKLPGIFTEGNTVPVADGVFFSNMDGYTVTDDGSGELMLRADISELTILYQTSALSKVYGAGNSIIVTAQPATVGDTVTYQWYLNGEKLEGETDTHLVVTYLPASDTTYTFTCEVTDSTGTVTSAPIPVKVKKRDIYPTLSAPIVKEYDGTATVALTEADFTFPDRSFVSNDAETFALTVTAQFEDGNVGENKPVTWVDLAVTPESAANNYNVILPTVTGSIIMTHAHPICGVACGHDPLHGDVSFVSWSETDSLPTVSGHYVLTGDVNMTAPANEGDLAYWTIPDGVEITLCLNGHDITVGELELYYGIYVAETASLTFCDCQSESGTVDSDLCITGALTIYGGTFTSTDEDHGGIDISGGSFTMYGGTITGHPCDAVWASGSGSVVNVYGGSIVDNEGDGFQLVGGTYHIEGVTVDNDLFAIYLTGGTLTVKDAILTGNPSGGIYMNGGTATVTDSTISANGFDGIYMMNATLTLTDSTLSSTESDGIDAVNSTVTITDCIFEQNGSDGIEMAGGTLTVTDTIIRSNGGDGIDIWGGQVTVDGCTIKDNEYDGILTDDEPAEGETEPRAVKVTITDTTISGSYDGLDINGGEILFENSTIENGRGDGIELNKGTVKMTSGTVRGNAESGVFLSNEQPTFEISGGVITGNQIGGIAVYGTLILSGDPDISGNTCQHYDSEAPGIPEDLWIGEGAALIQIGDLADDVKIGISMDVPGIFSATGTADKLGHFFSQQDGYYIEVTGTQLQLRGTYSITFDANGGTVTPSVIETGLDKTLPRLPNPTRPGWYIFEGWYTAPSGGERIGTNTVFTAHTTVYAHWRYQNFIVTPSYFTLTFDTAGGEPIDSIHVYPGTYVELSSLVPVREDHVFTGWYADPGRTTPVDSIRMIKHTTVYAGWIYVAPEHPFKDIDEDTPYYDAAVYAYQNGLFEGVAVDRFGGELPITRGMIVTVLWRMEGKPAADQPNPFPDVKRGSYYEDAVIWAAEHGIVLGHTDGNYAPDDDITREQLVAILYRYAQYKGVDVSVGENTNILSYPDFDDISEYAIPAMQWVCGESLFNLRRNSTLAPTETALRWEVANLLMNYLEEIE